MDYPKIWFLRHGETVWNAQRRVQGQLEADLTPKGEAHANTQAALMAPILRDERPRCVASPMRRAMQTAVCVFGERAFETDDRLKEIHTGDFQGRTVPELEIAYPEIYGRFDTTFERYCRAPGGEGFDSLSARVDQVLSELSGPTVIVGHGQMGKVLRGRVLGLSQEEMAALSEEQGCVYVLENGRETVLRAP